MAVGGNPLNAPCSGHSENRRLSAIALRLFRRIGLYLMAAIATPYDKAGTGDR